MDQFAARLRTSGLHHGPKVAQLLDEEEYVVVKPPHPVLAGELAKTYAHRYSRLSAMTSEHARQLAACLGEFVSRLRDVPPDGLINILTIRGNDPFHYAVFESADGQILGCHEVVSKLEVSEEQWRDLWEQS
jgi:hypothetical protein